MTTTPEAPPWGTPESAELDYPAPRDPHPSDLPSPAALRRPGRASLLALCAALVTVLAVVRSDVPPAAAPRGRVDTGTASPTLTGPSPTPWVWRGVPDPPTARPAWCPPAEQVPDIVSDRDWAQTEPSMRACAVDRRRWIGSVATPTGGESR
jgi:hypothetical protein